MNWQKKLEQIPDKSGVYLFKDSKNEILYIGKASSLKERLKSYIQQQTFLSPRLISMLSKAEDVEVIVTDSELEALILEANLIKRYKPKYNVKIKDDKRYPWLKLTVDEDFPRLVFVRQPKADKNRYFGPYPIGGSLPRTLRLIRAIFPIRTCKLKIKEGKPTGKRPCLNYYIHRCLAPCCQKISKEEYKKVVDSVIAFLEGKHTEVIRQLEIKMKEAADRLLFEQAAIIRDQIEAIKAVQSKQRFYLPYSVNQDILGIKLSEADGLAAIALFSLRSGKLIGGERYFLDNCYGLTVNESLSTFIQQHYTIAQLIPKELILPVHLDDETNILKWLSSLKGSEIKIIVPERGELKRLVDMAIENAVLYLEDELRKRNPELGKLPSALVELKSFLNLSKPPIHIEAFDVSTISGEASVGSVVVFRRGEPVKSEYRRFRIKEVEKIDDYAMIHEIVYRRYRRLLDEKSPLPDLILVDGGAGQLQTAKKALEKLGLLSIPTIGLAKQWEEIYLPDQKDPILLPHTSAALQLLRRIRDEAHRFAISYHRKLRKKISFSSILDELPGIGEKRKLLLLEHFNSIDKLKNATVEELVKVPGISKKLAEKILKALNPTTSSSTPQNSFI